MKILICLQGGQDGIAEYESFNPEDTGELCENNPQDPLCFVQPVGGQGAPQTDIFGPVDGEPSARSCSSKYWILG